LVVATYNVHRCIGTDGRCDPDRVCAVLREIGADLVGLQEIASGVGGQLEHIAKETGLSAVAGPLLPFGDHHLGNALLARYALGEPRVVPLDVDGREPRAAIDVDVRVDEDDWRVLVTHFGLRGRERRHQAVRLLRAIEARPATRRTLILGDVNEWMLGGRSLRRLRAAFGGRSVPSFPSLWPLLALDQVLIQPAGALGKVWAHRSPLSRVASDHVPIVATVLG
jgi:endonuclease/exonuclease/phosphatase family metal-dependent hydrolase